MYDEAKTIQRWVNSLDIDSIVPSSPEVQSYLHLTCDIWEEVDDKNDLGGLSVTVDASAWLTHHIPSLSDSGSDSTATSVVSDGDAMAQFIDIAWDSPWYHRPRISSPVSSSSLHDSHSCACSPDVRQAMAQQELLLDLFHEELRRIIPSDHDYDCAWLEDVDPDLVLSPVQSYEELCWRAATSEPHITVPRHRRPLPDVPVGCEGQLDDAF